MNCKKEHENKHYYYYYYYYYLFNKENIQIKSSSFLHTFSQPDKKYNSTNRINSSIKGEERYSSASSQSSNIVSSTAFPVFLHAIQQVSSHPMQGNYSTYRIKSPKNTTITRLIPGRQIQGILQQLFPMHPSILHGRHPPGNPIRMPRLSVILPTETTF